MEEQEGKQSFEDGKRNREGGREEDCVLQFLDSIDSYLCLMESLSSTLRQGWLELASARHSMGTSRVTSALFDLKPHSAATRLQVTPTGLEHSPLEDPMVRQPHFTLSKWSSFNREECFGGVEVDEEFQKKSQGSQLLHRRPSQYSELQEARPENRGAPLSADDGVQKERSKSLSVFGTLVSPKLRAGQHSFETGSSLKQRVCNGELVMTTGGTQEYVVNVWSGNHPFYLGNQSALLIDADQVEKCRMKYGELSRIMEIPVLTYGETVLPSKRPKSGSGKGKKK